MLKKLSKIVILGLVTLVFIESAAAGKKVMADSATSKSEVSFTKGDDGGGPTDPEEPGEPGPEEPEIPGGEEGLYLVMTPKLDFGSVKISKQDMNYYAKAQYLYKSEEEGYIFRPNYVEVVDVRGNAAGWSISVTEMSQFICKEGNELDGARIILKNGRIKSAMDGWEESDVTISDEIVLNPNETKVVMRAARGTGAGRWYGLFGDGAQLVNKNSDGHEMEEIINGQKVVVQFNPNIVLDVPGATEKYEHNYTTTLLWTVSNIP